jgi:hypothetical protein
VDARGRQLHAVSIFVMDLGGKTLYYSQYVCSVLCLLARRYFVVGGALLTWPAAMRYKWRIHVARIQGRSRDSDSYLIGTLRRRILLVIP